MSDIPKEPVNAGYRAAIHGFIRERLQAKLDKLKEDDPKRQELLEQHLPHVWLEDAARRVQQIHAVTHSLKPIHPDARGTNLYVEPRELARRDVVGSHVLGEAFTADVVGNAAALDVYKLLKLDVQGRTLLTALLDLDDDAINALHDDPVEAQSLREAFISLTQPRAGGPSSHTRAKQMYWLTSSDACVDEDFELLAPLFATSLAHAVYGEIQTHRFGDSNKAARAARRERKWHDGIYHDYPGLAAQKMGGTKPQNISQLNSERGGVNYLLSSQPPSWTSSPSRLPVHAESVFDKQFSARPLVRQTLRALRRFLESDPEPNLATRERRASLLDALVDELVCMAGELQQVLPPGWTRDDQRFDKLHPAEKLWLDPLRSELPDETEFAGQWLQMAWPEVVGHRFANWVNAQLKHKLPMGDAEAHEWSKVLLNDEEGFRQQLRDMRKGLMPHAERVA